MLKGLSEEQASNSIVDHIDDFIKYNRHMEEFDGIEKNRAKHFTKQLKKSHSFTYSQKKISEHIVRSCIVCNKDVEKDLCF